MTQADDRLKALFAAETPPARDHVFEAAVLERLARRAFLTDMVLLTAASLVGGGMLWAVWPVLGPALAAIGQALAPAAMAMALAALFVAVGAGRVTGGET